MLILSRKVGERIIIGDNIFIDVVDMRGSRVRIGITAPQEIPVDREEVRRQNLLFEFSDDEYCASEDQLVSK